MGVEQMELTEEQEKEFVDNNLTTEDREEIKKIVDEMQAIHILTKEGGELYRKWMHDSERFMGFTFSHTKALVTHSKTLNFWTKVLVGTASCMILLAIAQIIIFIKT